MCADSSTTSDRRWIPKKSDRGCSGGGYSGSRSHPAPEITQSRRKGNDNPASPQVNQRGNLVKSAPVDRSTDVLPLVKGNTLHQIFQTEQFIFNVSSTFEKLYRYTFDPITNEVIEIVVFKRVRNGDPELGQLRIISPKRRFGTPTSFCDKTYDVYALISHGCVQGYMLFARAFYGYYQTVESERMYFAFEKYEKKGR